MDYQVIWWREALGDVDKIAEYIAKDSPLYAQSVIEQLITNSRNILFVVAWLLREAKMYRAYSA